MPVNQKQQVQNPNKEIQSNQIKRATFTNQIMERSEEIRNHLWPKDFAEEEKE